MDWLGWVVLATACVGCSRAEPAKRTATEVGSSGSAFAATPLTGTPTVLPATTEFWQWFVANAAALRADKDGTHVMTTINEHFEPTHPGIFVEVGDGDERLLVISADGDLKRFGDVEAVYAARPTVPGWKIVAFRPRDPEAFTTEMNGYKLDPKQMKFVVFDDAEKLALSLYVPHFVDKPEMKQGLFIVLDHTVGEFDMETRISSIDFAPIEKAPASAQPLPALPATIDQRFGSESVRRRN